MRKVSELISQVRAQTENEDQGLNFGIKDSEFLQYINDAQHRLQSLITATHPTAFVQEEIQNVTQGVQSYPLSDLALMENKVTSVEYSSTNSDEDYYHLEALTMNRRSTWSEAYPCAYIRRSGNILLQPKPSVSGLLRINYVKRLYDLDTRRGTVLTSTISGNSVTNLTLDVTNSKTPLDTTTLQSCDYICVVDRDGNMKMRNIPIDGINTATGEISILAGYEFEDGESISASDFVTCGRDSTTHSELPKMAERYLIAYAARKILFRDSSVDVSEQHTELKEMEQDIVNSFADIDDDIHRIPLINRDR